MKHVTKITLTPSTSTLLDKRDKLTGSLCAVEALLSALKQHRDPVVGAHIAIIEKLALVDWKRNLESQMEAMTEPGFDDYEYSLSGGPKYFAIETKNPNEIEIREKPGNTYSQITIAFVDGTVENPEGTSFPRGSKDTIPGFILNDEKVPANIKREIKVGDVVCLFGHRITVVP